MKLSQELAQQKIRSTQSEKIEEVCVMLRIESLDQAKYISLTKVF